MSRSVSTTQISIPAQAGTHLPDNSHADKWFPACAGMLIWVVR
jgi:hypothetical protein